MRSVGYRVGYRVGYMCSMHVQYAFAIHMPFVTMGPAGTRSLERTWLFKYQWIKKKCNKDTQSGSIRIPKAVQQGYPKRFRLGVEL